LNKVTSATVGQCLPHGTKKPFPLNCLSLMTQSGAKGSMVNFSQIAACLGQQELEGRRVPRMTSGKTLPCFQPHDVGPRAGGYIQDRFFSGLRPQEYFFHCMAGREGLVDTAVKTSRSGYLQRCLVKNLEALRVHYDHTVRDCDGAVVQFQYGDDAVDVTRGGCLNQFKFLAENPELVRANLENARRAAGDKTLSASDTIQKTVQLKSLASRVFSGANEKEKEKEKEKHPETPLTATRATGSTLGVLPEKFADDLDAFLASTHPEYFAPEFSVSSEKKKSKSSSTKEKKAKEANAVPEKSLARAAGVSKTEFETLMRLKFLDSLAVPGEAVGCVAAQSVGEPSTQMTLNTFHFAGRGEANVTLGIPRLRELLMAAAKKLATPVMTLPLRDEFKDDVDAAKSLARRLRRVRLAELVKKLTVEETACGRSHGGAGALARTYRVRVELRGGGADGEGSSDESEEDEDSFDSDESDAEETNDVGRVTFAQTARAFKREFAKRLVGEIKLELRRRGVSNGRIHAGREEGTRTGAEKIGSARDANDESFGDDDSPSRRASAAAAAAKREDGEDGDDSDDDGAEDEEGAKTEGRRGARGDGDEKYTEKGDDEKRAGKGDPLEKGAGKATAVETEMESSEREDASSSGSGSDDAMATSSDSDSDSDSGSGGAAEARKKPPARPKTPSRGGALLESLEEIVESVSVDRAGRACELTLSLALGAPRLLMLEMAEQVAASTIVRATPGIDKTFVIGKPSSEDPAGKSPLCVQTDGVNFAAAWANDDLVRCSDVRTNDVYAMLTTYGVEAARQTLVAEVKGVFAVYGIGVDARHLSLIGDFMMQQGDYRPCSRAGMETSTSPLLKMSFETAAAFLVDATLKGSVDELESPSAKIVLGQVVEMGTGSFGLRFDVDKAAALREEMKTEKY
jgi:DNA-directed RNA polymerase I subunit RPA1